MPECLLRLPEIMRRTGMARASIYAAIARGAFPKPIPLGLRSVAWPSGEIDAWIAAKIASACRERTS